MRIISSSSSREGLRYSRPNTEINIEALPTCSPELTMQVEKCRNLCKNMFDTKSKAQPAMHPQRSR